MTFRVMNKVMNNFKKQGNSIVIQSVNENVTIPTQLNIQKGQSLLPFFFITIKITLCPNDTVVNLLKTRV